MNAFYLALFLCIQKVRSDSSLLYQKYNINDTNPILNETICVRPDGSLQIIPIYYKSVGIKRASLLFTNDIIDKVNKLRNRSVDPRGWFCEALNQQILKDGTHLSTFGHFGRKTWNLIACIGWKRFKSCSVILGRCGAVTYGTAITYGFSGIGALGECLPIVNCGHKVFSSECFQDLLYNNFESIES